MERWKINIILKQFKVSTIPHFVVKTESLDQLVDTSLKSQRENHIFFPASDEEIISPFPVLLIQAIDKTGRDQWIYLRNEKSGYFAVDIRPNKDDEGTCLITEMKFSVDGSANWKNSNMQSLKFIHFDWDEGALSIPEDEIEKILKSGWVIVVITIISTFLHLSTFPGHSIIQSFPREKKNDIKWILSHAHYLIIDNKESETIAHSGITRKFDGTITRAMHTRRAHFRTLHAPRYKQNIGKKIWVHACWVGPKEWEGTDKKIYKLMNTRFATFHDFAEDFS